ncbi:MAG TPA: hypothetical protein VM735_02010, partial [Candidatus Kapabacteria bacterium]|nr:hypothetical protein [Candidatus Kapabacteria bacterium]
MKKDVTKERATSNAKPAEKGWRRIAPWIIAAVIGAWVISGLRTTKNTTEFKIEEFSQMPVLLNGRVQPWDSVARNSLLMLRGKSTVPLTDKPVEELGFFENPKRMTAMEWLLEAMTRPQLADTRYVIRIDNSEVLNTLKLPVKRKYFSFNEIRPNFEHVQHEADRIREQRIEEQAQTAYQKGVMKVNFRVNLYFRIKNSIRPENLEDFAQFVFAGKERIAPGLAALAKAEKREEHNTEDLQGIMQLYRQYDMMSRVAYPMIIPPKSGKKQEDWANIGTTLKETLRGGEIPQPVLAYVRMADAYGSQEAAEFNKQVDEYRSFLAGTYAPELKKGAQENFFNHYEPFYRSILVYLCAFLFGCIFWMNWARWTQRTAFYLLLLAAVVHTSGLIFRMYLEGRPPVTNLYSSAIFVGWGAVLLGIVLERIWKDGIGGVTAAAVGVATLIIA